MFPTNCIQQDNIGHFKNIICALKMWINKAGKNAKTTRKYRLFQRSVLSQLVLNATALFHFPNLSVFPMREWAHACRKEGALKFCKAWEGLESNDEITF